MKYAKISLILRWWDSVICIRCMPHIRTPEAYLHEFNPYAGAGSSPRNMNMLMSRTLNPAPGRRGLARATRHLSSTTAGRKCSGKRSGRISDMPTSAMCGGVMCGSTITFFGGAPSQKAGANTIEHVNTSITGTPPLRHSNNRQISSIYYST